MPEPTIQEYIESVTEAKVKAALMSLSDRISALEKSLGIVKVDVDNIDDRLTVVEANI